MQEVYSYFSSTSTFASLFASNFNIFFSGGIGVDAQNGYRGIEPLNLCYVTIASIISENTNDAKSE